MALTINGSTGISGLDGSASAPPLRGTDSNTGITFGSDIMGFATGGTERVKITSAGRVGINEGTPLRALHISGSTLESSRIRCTRSGNSAEFGLDGSGDLTLSALGTGTDGQIKGFVGGSTTADFTVLTDGRFVLGNPDVNTTVDHSLVCNGRIQSMGVKNITTGSSANVHIRSSTGLMFRSTSSSRYKKDITDATWGLADVLKLRSVTYKSNATGENADDNTYGGFIAEEVHSAGLINFVEYNDSNQPESIHYANMGALMAKAIQELNAKVTTLETKVAALEAA